MSYQDKNGRTLLNKDLVLVPAPTKDDLHSHEFEGTIVGFRVDLAQVEDQEGNVFEIETNKLELSGWERI